MTKYIGVDLAGDNGSTGVALITSSSGPLTYAVPSRDWRGSQGLLGICELTKDAACIAVDQPFAYPATTMRLLSGPVHQNCTTVDACCWRETDKKMRQKLSDLGVSQNYVLSPTRCQNIWRGLALASALGMTREQVCRCDGRIIETHPRVALAIFLGALDLPKRNRLVAGYKGGKDFDSERRAREELVNIFEDQTQILPAEEDDRQRAIASDDQFEAVICAYVALLHSTDSQATWISGFADVEIDYEALLLEGAAVLPIGGSGGWSSCQ